MKRAELVFNIVSIPVDILSLALAAIASFLLRVRLDPYLPIVSIPSLADFFEILVWVIPGMLLIYAFAGLYNLKGTRKFYREAVRVIIATTIALFIVILVFFFDQRLFPSRLIILNAWLFAIVFVIFGRFILKQVQRMLLSRGKGLHKLVVIGDGVATDLIQYIKNHPSTGYKVVAELSHTPELLDHLEHLYQEEGVEEILHVNSNQSSSEIARLVKFARAKGLNFNYVPNLYDTQQNIVSAETLYGTPVISLKNTPLVGWGSVSKRIFDIIVSILSTIITLPIMLVIMLMIKLDSPGPVFYVAQRGGMGKDFPFLKFRSMYTHLSVGDGYGGEDAEKVREELARNSIRQGPIPKIQNDPRVTKVGRFLRKTKLDEIPQFLNVIKGDLSMVGPRAHVLDELEKYRDQHRRLFTIKPGIFGLAQIAQMDKPDLSFEEEVQLNTEYIENWSTWLDIKILANSFYYLFFKSKNDLNT